MSQKQKKNGNKQTTHREGVKKAGKFSRSGGKERGKNRRTDADFLFQVGLNKSVVVEVKTPVAKPVNATEAEMVAATELARRINASWLNTPLPQR